jgi:ketosteroid isomerase-like protein
LTRDYPHMPEPYNNLAVLYAADGQERKAAEALEQAIRTNPSYSTAHENLGDLYARMASEAYSKALQLDGSRQDLKPKLALITQIVPGAAAARPKATVAKAEASAASAPVAPAAAAAPVPKPEPVVVAKAPTPAPAPAPVVAPALAPAPVAVAAAPVVAAAKPSPAKPEPVKAEPAKPEASKTEPAKAEAAAKPAKADAADADKPAEAAAKPAPAARPAAVAEVERAVHAWAAAWQKKDMAAYLDAYSDKFQPAGGGSLAAWKEGRRVRIVGKQEIEVGVRNLQVSVDGDEATAKFRQHYVAGSLNTTTRKTLQLRHEKGQWHIVRESTGG